MRPFIEINIQKRIEVEKKWRQRWKNILQINEQCYIR